MKLFIAALLVTGAAIADPVTDWNTIMCALARPQGAHIQSRVAAITHLAMFDAVNSITREFRPYLAAIPAPSNASAEAAAVVAAHRVLTTYYPASATTLDASRAESLARIPDGPAKAAGVAVGDAAANALVAHRANDGSGTAVTYMPRVGVGYWQPTPPGFGAAAAANWGGVTPFAMRRGDQFRSDPPPALTSRVYTRDYAEVKTMGSAQSPARPQDRADLARYMAMTSPTQLWNHVAVQLSAAHRLTLTENARAFALMNMAVADAAVAVFDAKYTYHFWRPVTAIRAADIDGNSQTEQDANFTTFIASPAYPSYPSGFGALSNAARAALAQLFGKKGHSLELAPNPAVPDMSLRYSSLSQLTDDIADARVYGGIHFRFEQEEAEDLGEQIARYVMKRQLRPAHSNQPGDEEGKQ